MASANPSLNNKVAAGKQNTKYLVSHDLWIRFPHLKEFPLAAARMRSPIAAIVTALAVAGTTEAVGRARVVNNCPFAVSVWSVGGQIQGPYRLNAGGGFYAETFFKDPQTGGKALKVTIPADGLYTGAPQTNFAYNLDGASIWYDLSDVFGDPFVGRRLLISSAQTTCPSINWPNGTPPAGSQVKVCTSERDVTFTICA
jgi:hypothetical protein